MNSTCTSQPRESLNRYIRIHVCTCYAHTPTQQATTTATTAQKPTGLAGLLTSQTTHTGLTAGQTTTAASQASGGLKLGTVGLAGTTGQTGLLTTQPTGLKLGVSGLQPTTATAQTGLKLGAGLPSGTSTATAGLGGLGLQTRLTGLNGQAVGVGVTAPTSQPGFRGLGGVDPSAATGGERTGH